LLKPFTAYAVDLAGAVISPLLALLGGWFLWWWSRRMKFRYRWAMLVLYAISPILVQGNQLGRPDHQSLAMLLVTVAICAEWTLQDTRAASHAMRDPRMAYRLRTWSAVSGVTWALAIWISAYEPLLLFLVVMVLSFVTGIVGGPLQDRHLVKHCWIGWILFALIIAIALLIERRIPSLSIFQSQEIFKNWARTIGELARVSPANPIWFRWAGYMIAVTPMLIWFGLRKRKNGARPLFISVLLVATYCLTIWQARWGYFFMLIFIIALPILLEPIKSRTAVWVAFMLSIFPILRDWDERLGPSEVEYGRRVEQRNESVQLRDLALTLQSSEVRPFLAPWWLSPSIAYWSGQPGVAGSSHESLPGIEESARFFLAEDRRTARKILNDRRVAWVIAYDYERVAQNSAAILGLALPQHPLCFVLDRTPAQVPRFLVFSAQNGAGKLYRVVEQ